MVIIGSTTCFHKIHNGNSTFRLNFSHHQQWIKFDVVFIKREVVFYQSTKGRGRSPRPFVL